MLADAQPIPPQHLHPLARQLLERLSGHPAAAEIVIGGGVALAHYIDYRDTVDLDAWWREKRSVQAIGFIEEAFADVAAKHGCALHHRGWGDTDSFELVAVDRTVFSFQISERSHYLAEPIKAAWPPVLIETLADNLASKLTALVQRGAPRDFVDIYEAVHRGLIDPETCWQLWQRKNVSVALGEAKRKVMARLEHLEVSRPLESIQDSKQLARAQAVRRWYRDVFTTPNESSEAVP